MTWHQWHQTAPMSRRIGLLSALRLRKSFFAKLMPLNGLMHRRAQVGRRSAREGVVGRGGH